MAVREAARAELDARVGRGHAAEAKLQRELEIAGFALPIDELVLRQFFAGLDFAGDGTVLYAPGGRIAVPALEGAAIEQRERFGRGQRSQARRA
jgi:hypothetical protein